MTEPNDGLKLKDCCVCINDTYVELLIFDEDVIVPVLETETVNKESVSGKVWYLDNEHLSYVFYGTSNNNGLCVVSVISHDGRYTFAKTFSDNLGMKNYINVPLKIPPFKVEYGVKEKFESLIDLYYVFKNLGLKYMVPLDESLKFYRFFSFNNKIKRTFYYF